ncbi:unnamed protein product [Protopolystoma xenopodis]|uniref:Ig-like domain-containing protein n=1 Tax=Protopolystoma xenopodis TaxID=117903 RepID=A0A448X5J6_9PLAT|nr:unnamed protein product [Protopolystoma xenopodis]
MTAHLNCSHSGRLYNNQTANSANSPMGNRLWLWSQTSAALSAPSVVVRWYRGPPPGRLIDPSGSFEAAGEYKYIISSLEGHGDVFSIVNPTEPDDEGYYTCK